jgi:zinc transporter ZupT
MLYLILFGVAASAATFLGGVLALRFRDKLHIILGFSAGAVMGVAFFDLMPEAFNLAGDKHGSTFITTAIAIGFLAYMFLDRLAILRYCPQGNCENPEHRIAKGRLGAGSLSIHSFLDGIAIGLAFQVSSAIGAIVTTAVLTHDFSDGVNTINLILKNTQDKKQAFRWLIVDSLSPFLGVVSTMFFKLPESVFGIVLAVFCGFFLYIGASDLLPESHHNHPKWITTIMTVLGMAVLFFAIRLASI